MNACTMQKRTLWLTPVLLALLTLPVATRAAPAAVQQQLELQVAQLRADGGMYVQGLALASGQLLPDFYAARGYAPVWTRPARVDELLELLATAESHGLSSEDYYLSPLKALRSRVQRSEDPVLVASLDMLLTESLIRFGYHQRFGKVNPSRMEPTWNFTRQFRPGQDPLRTLTEAVAAPSLSGFLGQWVERAPLYRTLQSRLSDYRRIAAAGGWPAVPDGPTFKPGDTDARLATLRERLAITGDLAGDLASESPLAADVYADALVEGVRHFQARHSLAADGVLGRRTLDALNVPVGARVDQLRLTLERARWVLDETAGEVVVVNVAGYEVFAARNGTPFWRRRAVVGTQARETPIFKGSMTYLDLNPTWTVPPTILREDMLPKVRRDPGYLRAQNISVLDRNGRVVDPATINWAGVGGRPPYTFRQGPGPRNALGRIKFMFPNSHSVFLHDTPSRGLFEQAERNFSSGCIRVEDPLSLAEIVLGDPGRWNRRTLEEALATGKTRTLRLPKPWPVLILYWTAELDGEGQVRFLPDSYRRDPALLTALDGKVVIDFPSL
ncbi:MAG: L,D-transpeptidase family protein [Gammaproteobacteria bacterium]